MPDLIAEADEFTLNSQTGQDQTEVRFVALQDGGFVAIWRNNREDNGSSGQYDLRAQRYDADGQAVGSEFEVSGALTGTAYNHTAVALSDGTFVVAWEDTSDSTIVARLFNADGTPAGAEFQLTSGARFDVSLAALDAGGFVATWTDFGTSDIRAQLYDASGNTVGTTFTVNATTSGSQVSSDTVSAPDGGFIVVWQDNSGVGGDTSSFGVKMRRFDANGQPVGGETLVNTTTTGNQGTPKVAFLDNGGFVVTWVDSAAGGAGAVKAQIFNASGQPVGTEFSVSASPGTDETLPTIIGTEGGFFISWSEGLTGGNGDIRGQLFTNAGARVGGEAVINASAIGSQTSPALALLTSGEILAGWSDDNRTQALTGVAINDIEARLFFNPAEVQTGTNLAETINGTANADVISGRSGDDLIFGSGGNDFIHGGRGADAMYGGTGDDIYVADNVSDSPRERVGEGIDLVQASASHTLRVNVENLTLTGQFSITGRGNDLENTITGNSGSNRMWGMGGNDTLIGNAGNDFLDGSEGGDTLIGGIGNDVYYVDTLSDTIVEAANEGYDTVRTTLDWTLGAGLDRIELLGSGDLDGTGNGLANILSGNAGANVLSGMDGNDRIFGKEGSDTVDGGAGGDWLEGGTGQDTFIGGAGSDRYVFREGDFGGATTDTADRIIDFGDAENDRIRLDLIDANTNVAGNQVFSWLGDTAFTGVAGQLRYEQIGGNTYVQGDTNGDGVADFMIRVDGLIDLGTDDFLF
ncbi:calcium-binding protein [Sphingomonas arenae]|uniref:calcium-binding protein n=1 Tax=Sphingomonas arenae TaxID=2812555 RepID=UPI0019676708|nr:calcium-binding protein [Sphingomonas arenae]